MRLLHARLRHVGLHRHLEVAFHPRLTLLGGANESGKSTLVEALHRGLFLRASATGRGVEELRSSRHGGQPEVEIAFAAAGREWLLRKRFSGASGSVQLSDGAGTSLSGAAAEERLAALLGVEAAVEGRQVAQLPQRWAHLWVRQGEAGGNPLQGKGPSYDLDRLVQQLQQRGSSAALESPLDRRVEALLQAERDQLYTATGKVKAGSPLAIARQEQARAAADLEQARHRLAQLESTLEELEASVARLQQIDGRERPALEARLHGQAEARRALEQTEAQAALVRSRREPLAQQLLSLRGQLQQLSELTAAQRTLQAEGEQGERSQAEQQRQQQQLSQELERLQQAQGDLQAALAERSRALELGQLLQERAAAAQRSEELTEQRRRFAVLQERAAALKAQLEPLPPISAEQLQALREQERRLALARGRAEAAAARLEVLDADQPLRLDDRPLQAGASLQIEAAAILQVGAGVRLRLSPGGGEAVVQAAQACRQAEVALAALRAPLGVRDGDEAEALLRRRSALESELAQLRRSAAEIPWQRLDSQLAAQAERTRQIEAALERRAADLAALRQRGLLPADPELDHTLAELRRLQQQEQARWQEQQQRQQTLLARLQQGQQQRQQEGARLGEIQGRLAALGQRQASLLAEHGDAPRLTARVAELERELAGHDRRLAELEQQRAALGRQAGAADGLDDDPARQLQRLLSEKDTLLGERGRLEQLCRSLGALDPQAALEQAEGAWEAARERAGAIEARAAALQLLLERFQQARSALADRYNEPMAAAIGGYLACLAAGSEAALFQFDAARGFAALQVRQGQESFPFERLSGGTREQVAAAVRLALAEVLAPAYDGSLPLVFDDAFTNSDPERLEGLRRMLERASDRGVQVLLLSCTPGDYADLAARIGAEVNLEPG